MMVKVKKERFSASVPNVLTTTTSICCGPDGGCRENSARHAALWSLDTMKSPHIRRHPNAIPISNQKKAPLFSVWIEIIFPGV
jgi:hypothetical protein